MAAHPELIRPDVLVADHELVFGVDVDDRGELNHLEPLRIVPAIPSRSARTREVSTVAGSINGTGGMRTDPFSIARLIS